MMSCGYRCLWRGLVTTIPAAHGEKVWDYDELVMPLVCVCGTDVYIGAGCVLGDRGAWRAMEWNRARVTWDRHAV